MNRDLQIDVNVRNDGRYDVKIAEVEQPDWHDVIDNVNQLSFSIKRYLATHP